MEKNVETIRPGIYERQLSFSKLTVQVTPLGEDYNILIWGGEKPHVGCTVLAVPRPSLTGDGSRSATASVLNVTGHKDEQICRYLAEQTAKHTGAVVACTGGFHIEHAAEAQIQEVIKAVEDIACEIRRKENVESN